MMRQTEEDLLRLMETLRKMKTGRHRFRQRIPHRLREAKQQLLIRSPVREGEKTVREGEKTVRPPSRLVIKLDVRMVQ
jgi:hypothetical protein